MQSEQMVFVARCIILFLFFTQASLLLIIKKIWYFGTFTKFHLTNKSQAVFSHLSIFTQLTVTAWLFGGSCWTRYWVCTSLVCKWHGWCCLFSFVQNSCSGTFRFIWYSNFMNCNSPISFIFERYMFSLIIVYLENTHFTYHCVCVCLFIFLLWSSVQNRDSPTPKFMAYIYHFLL